MEKLQITQDKLIMPHFADEDTSCDCSFVLCENCEISPATFHFRKDDSLEQSQNPKIENAKANAMLYMDAHNTYLEHPELPSELLRQNRQMKEALEKAEEALEWYMTECYPDNDNYQSFHDIGMNARSVLRECLTSCNKGKE